MRTSNPESNLEWQAWGKKDPLWAVATWDGKGKADASPWTDEEFYALGAEDWRGYRTRWQQYGLNYQACVEIGCGAGRITKQLVNDFSSVHAVDVSPDMIAYAHRHVVSPNVVFHQSSGTVIPVPDNHASAVFSVHVFQHFDSLEVGLQNFREVHRVLAPGGTFLIHIPIHTWPRGSRVYEAILAVRKTVGHVRASVNRSFLRVGIFRPIMRFLTYPVQWCFSELRSIGFERLEMVLLAPAASDTTHALVFGTKSKETVPI